MGGFTCAELGKRIPIIKNIGAAAIFATFIPSFLAFHHLLPDSILGFGEGLHLKDLELPVSVHFLRYRRQHFWGWTEASWIKGFLKIFVPLAAGSVAGGVVGTRLSARPVRSRRLPHVLLCRGPDHGRRRGRGGIPLSIGYSQILHQPQGDLFAQVLLPVMLGGLTAILLAGTLNYAVGKKYPHLTGEGRLQPGEHDELEFDDEDEDDHVDIHDGCSPAVVTTAVTLYLIGALAQRMFGFPAPVVMLVIAVFLKLARAVGSRIACRSGAFHVYKFFLDRCHLPAVSSRSESR